MVNGQLVCGGTVIASSYVLTAAHCVSGVAPASIFLFLGRNNIQLGAEPGSVVQTVAVVTVHPSYNPTSFEFDFAILQMSSPVAFTTAVQPACIPAGGTSANPYTGVLAVISGWGSLQESPTVPATTLQAAIVTVLPPGFCGATTSSPLPSQMCAFGLFKDACQGDSGGPMSYLDGSSYYVIGVTSFGTGCARPAFPGGYARVTAVSDWIKATILNTQCSPL